MIETMPISKFKATCLAAIERVRRTGKPIRVTRFGKTLADIVPSAPEQPAKRVIGSMAHTGEITGDLMAPLDVEWSALKR